MKTLFPLKMIAISWTVFQIDKYVKSYFKYKNAKLPVEAYIGT